MDQPNLEAVDALQIVDRIVPRPLLLMVGDSDPFMPLSASESLYERAQALYTEGGYTTDGRVDLFISEGNGHSFNKPMQRIAIDWFSEWLADDQKHLRVD